MSKTADQKRLFVDRIARLHARLNVVECCTVADRQLRDVLKGILDLLIDEL